MVLRAKELIFRLEKSEFLNAGNLLRQAVGVSPYFAPAHTLLAEWFAINLWEGWSMDPDKDRKSLESHVRRAISLSPGDGRAMALWGHSRFMFEREHDAAIRLFREAVDLYPNDSETLIWSVPGLAHGGDPAGAVENGTRAMQLSPLDPFLFRNEHFLSVAYYANENFDAAADLGLSSFRRAPDYSSNLRATIAALSAADRLDEAEPLVSHHCEIEPEFSVESFIPRHGFRDEADRRRYGVHLIRAGIPR